jgi:hypothetical protein
VGRSGTRRRAGGAVVDGAAQLADHRSPITDHRIPDTGYRDESSGSGGECGAHVADGLVNDRAYSRRIEQLGNSGDGDGDRGMAQLGNGGDGVGDRAQRGGRCPPAGTHAALGMRRAAVPTAIRMASSVQSFSGIAARDFTSSVRRNTTRDPKWRMAGRRPF